MTIESRIRSTAFRREAKKELKEMFKWAKAERELADATAYGRLYPEQKLCWIYSRASHAMNSDTDSIPAQIDRCTKRYEWTWKAEGHGIAVVEPDRVISASKIPFLDRPAGSIIAKNMRSGDVIMTDKLDRIYRSLSDFCHTSETLKRAGVGIDIGNVSMSSADPFYPMMMAVLVGFAEMESRMKGVRSKEALDRRRAVGAITGGSSTWKLPGITRVHRVVAGYGSKPLKFYAWDTWARSLMNAICIKADQEGWDMQTVRYWLNKTVLKETGIPKPLSKRCSFPLTPESVLRMYRTEKSFRAYWIVDAKDVVNWSALAKKFGELPRTWEKLQAMGWLEMPVEKE